MKNPYVNGIRFAYEHDGASIYCPSTRFMYDILLQPLDLALAIRSLQLVRRLMYHLVYRCSFSELVGKLRASDAELGRIKSVESHDDDLSPFRL